MKVIESLRRNGANSALRPALIIWLFGAALVDMMTALLGRMPLGLNFITSAPLFVTGIGMTLLLDRLRRRLDGRPRPLAWTLMAAALFLAAAIQTLADLYWLRWLSLTAFPEWQSWAIISTQRLVSVGLLYLWTFCLILAVIWANDLSGEATRSVARAAQAEAATHRAEAAALRLQLNPHFLFNTLNSIASLVTLDRKQEAESMIDQLAAFLRASLHSDPMADVTLADEIDTVDAYLRIEAARFGERLEVDIDVPDAALAAIVPNFILQPLVENAIKHGVAAARGAAHIRVAGALDGDSLVLSVVNEAAEGLRDNPSAGSGRKGIGLANIRQRLAIAHGDLAALETGPLPGGWSAVIRMPFRAHPAEQAA